MRMTGGQIVVRALEDEGIPFTFGIPGTHNIELYDALAASEAVRPILVTDEQSASFMADAVWRASGRLGCANVVPGAGLTHALSGIAEAFMDNIPLLVLGCGIRRDTGMAYQLHDVDQFAIVRAVTKAQIRPENGAEIYPAIRAACRIAREGAPGPVFVEIPANLYLFAHDVELDGREAGPGAEATPPAPTHADVDRAAELLRRARRPLLYLGLGAAGAGEDLVRLAERLDAPVATTFQGKGVFPESHPLFLWPGFGDAAPPFARDIAASCDATLAIGCKFGEVGTGSYGVRPPAPLIHVDIDPAVPGRNYPAELAICGSAEAFVRRLLDRLGDGPRADAGLGGAELRVRIRQGHAMVWRDWLADVGGPGVTPAHLLRSLQRRFGAETIFTADSGNGTFLAVECLRLDAPGKLLAPVDYSCMGYAVPAAIGAKLARPDAPVVALAGDGAFLMTGLELATAAHYGIAVAVIVLRDRELAQIAQFQDVALNRKVASEVHDYDLARLCEGVGVECLELEADDDVAAVLDRVAAATGEGRPIVVDCAIDYSRKTFFTSGVVRTNLLRLPWPERLRFVGRAVARKTFAGG
ncbi:MAG TPA: thiamine pyrophosphate-binding protein [Longimicrobiales bacterium]